MEVEVISKEIIKPSSPTPPDLRTYKTSLLDHLYPPYYIPIFIYYKPSGVPTNDIIEHKIPELKKALSKTLTQFYPLAGRVDKDLRHITCDDRGILFYITRVKNCTIAELMKKEGKMSTQSELFPRRPWVPADEANEYAQIALQMNLFECGGIGLVVLFSHKIIDGITIASFLKCWASISNNPNGDIVSPDYSAPLLFPSRESFPVEAPIPSFVRMLILKKGDCASKKFLFDAKAINSLKNRASSQNIPHPSRFEALSCFIWKHAMSASRVATGGDKRPSMLSFNVDLRRKMTPPLSTHTVGNIIWNVCPFYNDVETEEKDLDVLVGLVRAELSRVKEDIASKIQGVEGYDAICENLQRLKEIQSLPNLNAYMLTSWIGIGFYDVNFGWGKVANVGLGGANVDYRVKNIIYLMDAGSDHDGAIQAYINLNMAEMSILENDPEFLEFASPA